MDPHAGCVIRVLNYCILSSLRHQWANNNQMHDLCWVWLCMCEKISSWNLGVVDLRVNSLFADSKRQPRSQTSSLISSVYPSSFLHSEGTNKKLCMIWPQWPSYCTASTHWIQLSTAVNITGAKRTLKRRSPRSSVDDLWLDDLLLLCYIWRN